MADILSMRIKKANSPIPTTSIITECWDAINSKERVSMIVEATIGIRFSNFETIQPETANPVMELTGIIIKIEPN